MKKFLVQIKAQFYYILWILQGRKIPTNDTYKRKRIKKLAKLYNCDTFIETGTYNGKTLASVESYFKLLMSVELYESLYKSNISKFESSKNVILFFGDSAKQMKIMVEKIQGRCLFWLDGHYSGEGTGKAEKECPVYEELMAISVNSRKDHIILIDDAREFGTNPDYPKLDEVEQLLYKINDNYKIYIDYDCIIAVPNTTI